MSYQYKILKEQPCGDFALTGETWDSGLNDINLAGTAAQEYIDQLQQQNGGCYAAQLINAQ